MALGFEVDISTVRPIVRPLRDVIHTASGNKITNYRVLGVYETTYLRTWYISVKLHVVTVVMSGVNDGGDHGTLAAFEKDRNTRQN